MPATAEQCESRERNATVSAGSGVVDISAEIRELDRRGLLDLLLEDKTTGKNITWATDEYAGNGDAYGADRQIVPSLVSGRWVSVIRARSTKSQTEQVMRTRTKGEVFTPLWLCAEMNGHIIDEANRAAKDWKQLVGFRIMEITCGEAPFLVSRYDPETGQPIPVEDRIGQLDHKLRVVGANTKSEQEWQDWARVAYQSIYGYEYQGDSLLIARINMIFTLVDYSLARWGHAPDDAFLREIADVIAWNIFQMDGLTGSTPTAAAPADGPRQLSLFDVPGDEPVEQSVRTECLVYDWVEDCSIPWREIGNEV